MKQSLQDASAQNTLAIRVNTFVGNVTNGGMTLGKNVRKGEIIING